MPLPPGSVPRITTYHLLPPKMGCCFAFLFGGWVDGVEQAGGDPQRKAGPLLLSPPSQALSRRFFLGRPAYLGQFKQPTTTNPFPSNISPAHTPHTPASNCPSLPINHPLQSDLSVWFIFHDSKQLAHATHTHIQAHQAQLIPNTSIPPW